MSNDTSKELRDILKNYIEYEKIPSVRNAPGGSTIITQSGHTDGIIGKPNHVPDPSISLTVATLTRAIPNPRDCPIASMTDGPSPCFEEHTSHLQIIRQFTMMSGT